MGLHQDGPKDDLKASNLEPLEIGNKIRGLDRLLAPEVQLQVGAGC